MRTVDRLTFLIGVQPPRPPAERMWKFRVVQVGVVLIACFVADSAMTGGEIRRAVAKESRGLWSFAMSHLVR